MAYEPLYKTYEAAIAAVELAVEETIRDNPELKGQEYDVYHDMVQSVMYDCSDEVLRELARVTDVARVR